MQTLRRSRSLARSVAVWFLLWTGAMLAAPAVAAGGLEGVCTVGGSTLAPKDAQRAAHFAGDHAQCPACAHAAAPPPTFALPILLAPVSRVGVADRTTDVPHGGSAPPPARGPPAAA